MKFILNFLSALIGRKPTSTDVIVAALNTTVTQLATHAEVSQAKADDHATEILLLTAKQDALMAEAVKAAQVAANIGALLK